MHPYRAFAKGGQGCVRGLHSPTACAAWRGNAFGPGAWQVGYCYEM